MKKLTLALSMILSLSASAVLASGHEGHGHGVNSHGTGLPVNVAHEEVLDGIKGTFKVETMADAMKSMGMAMPSGIKETHHISVEFRDLKSGKLITEGEAKLKVLNPDKSDQIKDLMAMHGHFGADFVMLKSGKYGVICKFKPAGGKVRLSKFWYTVK